MLSALLKMYLWEIVTNSGLRWPVQRLLVVGVVATAVGCICAALSTAVLLVLIERQGLLPVVVAVFVIIVAVEITTYLVGRIGQSWTRQSPLTRENGREGSLQVWEVPAPEYLTIWAFLGSLPGLIVLLSCYLVAVVVTAVAAEWVAALIAIAAVLATGGSRVLAGLVDMAIVMKGSKSRRSAPMWTLGFVPIAFGVGAYMATNLWRDAQREVSSAQIAAHLDYFAAGMWAGGFAIWLAVVATAVALGPRVTWQRRVFSPVRLLSPREVTVLGASGVSAALDRLIPWSRAFSRDFSLGGSASIVNAQRRLPLMFVGIGVGLWASASWPLITAALPAGVSTALLAVQVIASISLVETVVARASLASIAARTSNMFDVPGNRLWRSSQVMLFYLSRTWAHCLCGAILAWIFAVEHLVLVSVYPVLAMFSMLIAHASLPVSLQPNGTTTLNLSSSLVATALAAMPLLSLRVAAGLEVFVVSMFLVVLTIGALWSIHASMTTFRCGWLILWSDYRERSRSRDRTTWNSKVPV